MMINGYCIKPYSDLMGANLVGANLMGANLVGANLRSASLESADLRHANLESANLESANLGGAYLVGANLVGANLRSANLESANLVGANLRSANLVGANLRSADLGGAKGLCFQIPQEGELIVYKQTRAGVIQLRVPPEARRTATPVGRKCRAEFVEVLEAPESGAWDQYSGTIEYRPGEIIRPDSYDPDWRIECTHGIHFFLTREEAEEW